MLRNRSSAVDRPGPGSAVRRASPTSPGRPYSTTGDRCPPRYRLCCFFFPVLFAARGSRPAKHEPTQTLPRSAMLPTRDRHARWAVDVRCRSPGGSGRPEITSVLDRWESGGRRWRGVGRSSGVEDGMGQEQGGDVGHRRGSGGSIFGGVIGAVAVMVGGRRIDRSNQGHGTCQVRVRGGGVVLGAGRMPPPLPAGPPLGRCVAPVGTTGVRRLGDTTQPRESRPAADEVHREV